MDFYATAGLAICCLFFFATWTYSPTLLKQDAINSLKIAANQVSASSEEEVSDQITPAPDDFDIQTQEPIQFRPYRPVYHVTMSIQNSFKNEEFEFDKQYLERIAGRRQVLREHFDVAAGCLPDGLAPMQEFYRYLLSVWLPTRLPRYFKINSSSNTLYNVLTKESHPLEPSNDWKILVSTIVGNIEDGKTRHL